MKFNNRLKGSVTQALIRSLLADSGITIVPLGIEEVIREVTDLPKDKYLKLNLSDSLRKLPDFFATNADRSRHWLLEVKFTRTWDDQTRARLEEKLTPQVRIWSPLHLVIFFGESPAAYQRDLPAAWVRVGKLVLQDDKLHVQNNQGVHPWSTLVWSSMDRIQDVFSELNAKAKWEENVIQNMLVISRHLSTLD